jgi:phospholipid/cholesterol/gamma-HCH transport system substrate-binding protein
LTEINRGLAGQSTGPLGAIVNNASDAVSHADAISKNLEAATAAIRDPTGLVPRLLDAKGSIKTLLDDKNALYDNLEGSMAELQRTLKNIQDITSSLSGEMPSIAVTIDEGRAAIKQAQDVLTGLKNNPLLKGGIPARVEQQPQSQSMREGQF